MVFRYRDVCHKRFQDALYFKQGYRQHYNVKRSHHSKSFSNLDSIFLINLS